MSLQFILLALLLILGETQTLSASHNENRESDEGTGDILFDFSDACDESEETIEIVTVECDKNATPDENTGVVLFDFNEKIEMMTSMSTWWRKGSSTRRKSSVARSNSPPRKEQRRSECEIIDLENMQGSQELLLSFEINKIPLPALLFQTGYLTIASYDSQTRTYTLKCPNVYRSMEHTNIIWRL